MERRERPGLLLDRTWRTPLYLFTAVAGQLHPGQKPGSSWLQSQPIRQSKPSVGGGGGGKCASDEDCNLSGVCSSGLCSCDAQWQGAHCGVLALLPADPAAGYRRPGFNGWGGNPFWSEHDSMYHVFTVEMTRQCSINDHLTNSQIVHAVAPRESPGGPYVLAAIGANATEHIDQSGPAPSSTVLAKPFAHGAHAWREDGGKGALVVVVVGRDEQSYPRGVPEKTCEGDAVTVI